MSSVPAARTIRTPAELAALLGELKQAVAAGGLQQLRPDPSLSATHCAVADIPEVGPWPNYIELRFRVPGARKPYKLAVETYHGSGGTWGAE